MIYAHGLATLPFVRVRGVKAAAALSMPSSCKIILVVTVQHQEVL